jgi:hypothetical protein
MGSRQAKIPAHFLAWCFAFLKATLMPVDCQFSQLEKIEMITTPGNEKNTSIQMIILWL